MGDKDYFHAPAVQIPLIIADPSASANPTRGTVDASLVELIDLLPTFIEFNGGTPLYKACVHGHLECARRLLEAIATAAMRIVLDALQQVGGHVRLGRTLP